jgi:hypothetical protein
MIVDRGRLALALAGGSALVAATWLVAQVSWQGRLRTLEAEVSLLRRTRQIDVLRLLNDLERLAGPAEERLAYQDLKQRLTALEREYRSTHQALEALRRSRRLEERFTLSALPGSCSRARCPCSWMEWRRAGPGWAWRARPPTSGGPEISVI